MVIGGSSEGYRKSLYTTEEPYYTTEAPFYTTEEPFYTTSSPGGFIRAVELVSLDPDNNPVPPCLTNLNNFPIGIDGAAGSVGEGRATKQTRGKLPQ